MTFAFPCVNVDLIYGIPGQTVKTLLASVEEAVSFGVDEIFLYPLYIRHGARLERELAGRTQPGVRGSADGLWAGFDAAFCADGSLYRRSFRDVPKGRPKGGYKAL